MTVFRVRFSSHGKGTGPQEVTITDCEFKDLEIAIRQYNENGFRDGAQRYGCVDIVEYGVAQKT
jgi:hypothetical protein